MNRQILFRGKRIIEPIKIDRYAPNGWVCGGLIEVDDEEAYILPYDISGEMYRNRPYRFRANDFEYTIMLAEVDPKTIGQFTGLTDKNGKKIFEGDIVKVTDEIVGYDRLAFIEFGNPNRQHNWGWQLHPISSKPFAVDILYWVDMEESGAFIEVIGNIYDNKEVLK